MTDKHKTPEQLAEEYSLRREQEVMHEGRGLSPFVYQKIERIAGFLAGYEAGRPKWVSVKEKLPEMYEEVLCVLPDRYEMVASMVPDDTWTDPEGREYEQKRFVIIFTHWMLLPNSPKDL